MIFDDGNAKKVRFSLSYKDVKFGDSERLGS